MTKEERIKILEMVAAGKLSVEQAGELMDILAEKSGTDAEQRPEEGQRAGEYNQEAMGRIRGYGKTLDRGLRATGLKWDKPDKMYGVDASYARALRETGLTNLTAEEIGALKMYGIGANYVKALREAGLGDLTVKQVISLYNYGINADYVRALLETGLDDLTMKQIIRLYNHGVSAKYVRDLLETGFGDLSVDQVISLYNHGVNAENIRGLLETGLSDLTVKQIIHLKNHGIDPLFAASFLNEEGK